MAEESARPATETVAAEPVSWSAAAPEAIGAFRIVRELGRGGMGVVFEAIEQPLGRRVALKVLPAELVSSHSARARFRREAQLAARLAHPAVCTIYGAGIESEHPWISMRLVEGTSLARHIASARRSDEPFLAAPIGESGERGATAWVATTIARLARALASAHALGIVHRDVKPSNVMITTEGEPVLLDFGLALEAESVHTALTRSGEVLGTPAYLSPETLAGEVDHPDAKSDVYSLGVTLYECLALHAPFHGPTQLALVQSILRGQPERLLRKRPGLPADLALVTETAMARDRARRYASADDFAADLEAFVAGRPIAARPISTFGRLASWARREPRIAALAGGLIVASMALAVTTGGFLAARPEVHAARSARRAAEIETTLTDGFLDLSQQELDRADERFEAVLARDPGNIEAHGGRVIVSMLRERPDEAQARLATAPRSAVFERMRRVIAGDALEDDGEFLDRASPIELFLEGMRLKTLAKRSPLSQRQALARRALPYFEEALLRSSGARALFHLLRAENAQEAGDPAAARSAAASLLALYPSSHDALWVAGSCLQDSDPQRAIEILRRAVELDPAHAPALVNLAAVHVLLDESATAEPLLRRAIELAPDMPQALNLLGLALKDLGRYDQARAAYRRAIELAPQMLEVWENLGDLEFAISDYPAALAAQQRAVAIDPDYALARYDLAIALYQTGRYSEARAELEKLLLAPPSEANTWETLAWTLLALGELEEASATIERGREHWPDPQAFTNVRAEVDAALAKRAAHGATSHAGEDD